MYRSRELLEQITKGEPLNMMAVVRLCSGLLDVEEKLSVKRAKRAMAT